MNGSRFGINDIGEYNHKERLLIFILKKKPKLIIRSLIILLITRYKGTNKYISDILFLKLIQICYI